MIDSNYIQDTVAHIQQHHAQFFMLQSAHFILHQGGGVIGAVHHRTLLWNRHGQAAAQLDGSLDLSGFGLPNAMLVAHILVSGAVEACQPAQVSQQALPHLDRVLTRHPHPQQNCQQLSLAERLRPQPCQPLARPFGFIQIGNTIGCVLFLHATSMKSVEYWLSCYNAQRNQCRRAQF